MKGYWVDTMRLIRKKKVIYDLKNELPSSIKFIELSNSIIRYKDIGTGNKTILFTPDAPNTIEHYETLCSLLKDKFRIIILELPGFGFSIPTTKRFTFTLNESTQTVIDFMDTLKLTNSVFCFPCVAGFIPFQIEELRPDLVDNIINIQTPSWQEEKKWAKRVDFKGIIGTPILGQILMQIKKRWAADKWYHAALPKDNYNASFLKTCNHAFDKGSSFSLASAFQGFFKDSDFVQKEKFKKKSIIIWGEKDRSHKKTLKESSLDYFQNGTIIQFKESGHFPELEFPEQFTQILIETFKTNE